MKIVAAVQARMASSRLPNKSMASILGRPMVLRVAERLKWLEEVDLVVLSIPCGVRDEALAYAARTAFIPFYAGEEGDLLLRAFGTAKKFGADAIVRITADCPLIDPLIVNQVVRKYKEGEWDYVSNVFPCRTHPAGQAVEVYSSALLDRLLREIPEGSNLREYPNVYVWNNPDQFRTANITYDPDLSNLRWTVDYRDDLAFVREVYHKLYVPFGIFHMEDVLALLERAPHIAAINAHVGTAQYQSQTGELWK